MTEIILFAGTQFICFRLCFLLFSQEGLTEPYPQIPPSLYLGLCLEIWMRRDVCLSLATILRCSAPLSQDLPKNYIIADYHTLAFDLDILTLCIFGSGITHESRHVPIIRLSPLALPLIPRPDISDIPIQQGFGHIFQVQKKYYQDSMPSSHHCTIWC